MGREALPQGCGSTRSIPRAATAPGVPSCCGHPEQQQGFHHHEVEAPCPRTARTYVLSLAKVPANSLLTFHQPKMLQFRQKKKKPKKTEKKPNPVHKITHLNKSSSQLVAFILEMEKGRMWSKEWLRHLHARGTEDAQIPPQRCSDPNSEPHGTQGPTKPSSVPLRSLKVPP